MAPPLLQAATLALRAATATCPASPTCPGNNLCSVVDHGVSLEVHCGKDYFGGDLQRAQFATLAGCINACSIDKNCAGASYVDQNCYLKNSLDDVRENSNVIGISVTHRPNISPTPDNYRICPSHFTCPENDGCSYVEGSRTLQVSCGVDFYGGDIGIQSSDSLQTCTHACAIDAACVAASFVGENGFGSCYLKGTKTGSNFNEKVNAVSVVAPYIGTCESINSGINLISNPSFELPGDTRKPSHNWGLSDDFVYVVNYPPAAHCGEAYMVFYSVDEKEHSMTQEIQNINPSRSYFVNINLVPMLEWRNPSCTLEVYANDIRILTQPTTRYNNPNDYSYTSYTTAPFNPNFSRITIKVQYKCISTSGTARFTSAILVDGITLAEVS